MRNNKRNKGFTLIELLIVIAIIGILAAVLIPNLLGARERAFDTAAQSCLKELATLSEITMIDDFEYSTIAEADYPATCDDVTISGGASADGSTYSYTGSHANSDSTFTVTPGGGVTRD